MAKHPHQKLAEQPKDQKFPETPKDEKAPESPATQPAEPDKEVVARAVRLSNLLAGEIGKGGAGETPEQALARVLKERDEARRKLETETAHRNADHQYTVAIEAKMEEETTAIIEERDRLKLRVSTPEAAAASSPLPTEGWSSPRARELVEMMAPSQRLLVLGDLLADLVLLAGEEGAKESAQDVLKRRVFEASKLSLEMGTLKESYTNLINREAGKDRELSTLKAAMVTERSPCAEAELRLAAVIQALGPASAVHQGMTIHGLATRVTDEWLGLRELLSKHPMVAVAVRDDSTPSLAERYSLGVLRWDGQRLKFDLVEGPARPWAELIRPMRHAVDTQLVPPTFR